MPARRDFPGLAAMAAVLAACAAARGDGEPAWLASSFRRCVTGADPQNADRMLAQIQDVHDCGADTVILTAHLRGRAWFPSKLAATEPKLCVEDAVADGGERCRRLGIRAVFYVGAPLEQEAVRDRMEWRQRRADGSPAGQSPALCLLSPGGDWLIDYLAELAAHAPMEGVWLDGYPQPALSCSCPHCAARYRADTGRELPQSASLANADFRRYVAWWHGQCENHAKRLTAAIHKAQPGAGVFANVVTGRQTDAWRFASDNLCRILDGPSVEQFWHVDRQGDALQARFALELVSAAAGKPVECYVPLLPHTVDCTTALPEAEILARNFTVLAAGAVPQSTYAGGRKEIYARLMSEIRRREPWMRGARRTRYCGIAASSLTALEVGRDNADRDCWQEVRGWLRAMTEAHIPTELLSDRQLAEGDLAGLQVLVLPGTACLPDEALRRIRDFASGGGGVIATCAASLGDAEGDGAKDFALADLLGVHFEKLQRREPLPSFVTMKPADHPLARGAWVEAALWDHWICLGHERGAVGLPGRYALVRAGENTRVAWRFGDGRAAVVDGTAGEAGKGRTFYFAPEVGRAYYLNSYPYLRSLMAAAVRAAAATPPADEVEAPLSVQATFFHQDQPSGGGRRIIHLLNEVSSFGRASLPAGAMPLREEVLPVAGIRLRVGRPAGRVHLEPEGMEIEVATLPDGSREAALPPIGLHSLVVIEDTGGT